MVLYCVFVCLRLLSFLLFFHRIVSYFHLELLGLLLCSITGKQKHKMCPCVSAWASPCRFCTNKVVPSRAVPALQPVRHTFVTRNPSFHFSPFMSQIYLLFRAQGQTWPQRRNPSHGDLSFYICVKEAVDRGVLSLFLPRVT